ncbi:phytoene desaturase [Aerococcaceae bacterium DSM 111176]|nr:phytoene desaturase [Aerococcaceae bacterium DSM 111176]
MKKVSVIGAGTAGLAAAVRLQTEGYDVHLYEKNSKIGGKMFQINEEGYRFDVGPTIVMTPDIYNEVFEYAGRDPKDYIPMQKLDPMIGVTYRDGKKFNLSNDFVELIKLLEEESEEDTSGFIKYMSNIYERYLVAKNKILNRSYRSLGEFINPKSLLDIYRLKTFDNAYNEMGKFIKNDYLKKMFAFQTLYIGISPHSGPSLYNMIPMLEMFYGIWHIKGGMYSMAKGMADLFEELGGTIHLNAPVEEILIEDKEAKGIRVNGEEILSDYTMVNADFPYTMTNLIPNEKDRGKYTDKKVNNMEYSCSCFILYLGVDKAYPTEAVHTFHIADDFDRNISDIFDAGVLPEDPSIYVFNVSQVDKSLSPEDRDSLYVLVPVPELSLFDEWTEETIQNYREKVLNILTDIEPFQDIKEHIRYESIYTPKMFEENFNAYNGATFGLRPSLFQSAYFRPHNKFDYADNLYFCGSSIHPGAGVPTVLQSAKLSVEELLKDDREK